MTYTALITIASDIDTRFTARDVRRVYPLSPEPLRLRLVSFHVSRLIVTQDTTNHAEGTGRLSMARYPTASCVVTVASRSSGGGGVVAGENVCRACHTHSDSIPPC